MKKYKVGYTTGVFDMFNVGYLNILKRSKELCEYLIVGVSTDDLVNQYKQKAPVICFEDRKAIVEAISYVDRVVPQETMDKLEAWQRLRFDVVFHGDDWKGSAMYNSVEENLKKVGCEMVYLPHTEGVSSTELAKAVYAYFHEEKL